MKKILLFVFAILLAFVWSAFTSGSDTKVKHNTTYHWFDAFTSEYLGTATVEEADCGGDEVDCKYGYDDIQGEEPNILPAGPLRETVKME